MSKQYRGAVLWIALAGSACRFPTGSNNPCPDPSAPLTCPNGLCCPSGYPYECNGQCYTSPSVCGANVTTCGASGNPGGNPGGNPSQCGSGTHYDSSTGACELNQSLAILNNNNHWAGGSPVSGSNPQPLYLEFFNDNTGKMSLCIGGACGLGYDPVAFNWQPGAQSDAMSIAVSTGPAPAAPTGLAATVTQGNGSSGSGSVSLNWSPVAGAAWYDVYEVNGRMIRTTNTSALYNGLMNGSYSYYVMAVFNWAESAMSTQAMATINNSPVSQGGPSFGGECDNTCLIHLNLTQLTAIRPNQSADPTSFSAQATTAAGTRQLGGFSLASGTF
jgi:hypothetical protein